LPYLLKGALIEYGTNLLGPLKNVVIFQFNPEKLTRTIDILSPSSPTSKITEPRQAGLPPIETITLTAHFSAADQLNDISKTMARAVGIGPQLAALEKMVNPSGKISPLSNSSASVDTVGTSVSSNSNSTKTSPRDAYPRILFIWGSTRVLPVTIKSMSITEEQYDQLLNPIQAEVSISLDVIQPDKNSDEVAKGAFEYSNNAKKVQAQLNLANNAAQAADLIPFV
jgi:hypothetical protein